MTEASPHFQIKKPQFNRSLSRTIILVLLLVTVIPIATISIITYLRATALIKDQATNQLMQVGNTVSEQLVEFSDYQLENIESLAQDKNFRVYVNAIINPENTPSEILYYKERISDTFKNPPGINQENNYFEQFIIIDEAGKILFSQKTSWIGKDLFNNPTIRRAINANTTDNFLVYDFTELYPEEIISLSISPIPVNAEKPIYLIGITTENIFTQLFKTVENFYPSSTIYYQITNDQLLTLLPETYNHSLLTLLPEKNNYSLITLTNEQQTRLNNINSSNIKRLTLTINQEKNYAYRKPLDELNSSLLITVPENITLSEIRSIGPFNLFLVLNLIIVSIYVVYYGISQIINPLVQLSDSANKFAQGQWEHRAKVNRRDEIGLLGYAFNQMVEQLAALYRSLEEKVAIRTQQMNTTSQIAQLATSAASHDEILKNTVDLLTERFNFSYAGIYIFEKVLNQLSLNNYKLIIDSDDFVSDYLDDFTIPINIPSVISDVVKNKQSFVSNNVQQDELFHYKGTIIPNSKSVAQIPIRVGQDIFGVLDIQSNRESVFDAEFVKALEALASQIGSGIRNISLLETTQGDLASTNILYQTTKQVSLLNNEKEIISLIASALDKTNFVSAVFEIKDHYLQLVKFNDRKGKKFSSNLTNITIPLEDENISYLSENKLFVSDDLENETLFNNLTSFFSRRGCISTALIPIHKSGVPYQLIALGSRDLSQFSSTVLDPFINLSEVTTNALEKLAYVETIENKKYNLELLQKIIEANSAENDLQLIYHNTHRILTDHFGEDINLLFAIYNKNKELIELPYIYENQELIEVSPFPIGEGLTSYVIKNLKSLLLVEEVAQKALEIGSRIVGKPAKSWLGVPLIINSQALGAIVIQDANKENRFNTKDLRLLETISPLVSALIQNAIDKNNLNESLSKFELDQTLFNTLLDNIPDYITFKNIQGQYLRTSSSFSQIYGLDNKQIIGKTDSEIQDPEAGKAIYLEDYRVIMDNRTIQADEEMTYDWDHNPVWIIHYKKPIWADSNQPVGLFRYTKNITDQRRAEKIAEGRANQVQTASEIARDTAGTLDLNKLIKNSVQLVLERFEFYHASIFLLDALEEYAVLEESTGEAGRKMKEAHHKLAVGSQSTVGAATATGKPVVNNDVKASLNYYPNPLLPDTQAELAIPLIAGGKVLGALDVQSTKVNAFTEEDIQTMQILSDQLAIAILNAELFAESEENLSKHRFVHQISRATASAGNIESAFHNIVNSIHTSMPEYEVSVYTNNADDFLSLQAVAGNEKELSNKSIPFGKGVIGEVALYKKPIKINDALNDQRFVFLKPNNRSILAVPLLYGEQLFGVLNLESKEPAAFDETDQEIMVTLGANLASTLSVIELIDRNNIQSARLRQMYEAADKIRRSPDIQAVLENSVNEISKMVGASKARIRVFLPDSDIKSNSVPEIHHNGHGEE